MDRKKRILMLIIGVMIIGLGTTICLKTSLGIDPFNAFCVSISQVISMDLGPTTVMINGILIVFIFMFGRSFIGFGTVFTMMTIGYFISFFDWILPDANYPTFSIANILIFIIGMSVMCFGVALYFESQLGMAPYDCFAFVATKYFPGKTFVYRIAIDCTASLMAFILGGPISVGTVILAGGLGPLIDFFRGLVNKIFPTLEMEEHREC